LPFKSVNNFMAVSVLVGFSTVTIQIIFLVGEVYNIFSFNLSAVMKKHCLLFFYVNRLDNLMQ